MLALLSSATEHVWVPMWSSACGCACIARCAQRSFADAVWAQACRVEAAVGEGCVVASRLWCSKQYYVMTSVRSLETKPFVGVCPAHWYALVLQPSRGLGCWRSRAASLCSVGLPIGACQLIRVALTSSPWPSHVGGIAAPLLQPQELASRSTLMLCCCF